MKRFILFFALFLAASVYMNAQQDARYTQYMFNKLAINPAYAGSGDGFTNGLSLTALYRTQWVGFEGQPRTISFSAHTPLGTAKKVGMGLYLEHDMIGVHGRSTGYLSYAYHFGLGGQSRLGIGLQGGGMYLVSDYTEVPNNGGPIDVSDPAFDQRITKFMPNFGVGLYFYNPTAFYVGASVPHLLDNDKGTPTKIAHQYRHYHFMAGGIIGPEAFKIKPSALLKVVPGVAPVQLDMNLLFLIKNAVWFGPSLRIAPVQIDGATRLKPESLDFIIAFQVKGFKVGYAYDLTLTKISNFTSGSHEIMLGYDVPGGKGPRYLTPRYF